MLVVCMRNIWGTIWTQSVVKKKQNDSWKKIIWPKKLINCY